MNKRWNDSKAFYFSNLFLDLLEDGRFVLSSHGNPVLLDKRGYHFKINRKSKVCNKTYWVCTDYYKNKNDICKARAVTEGAQVVQWNNEHNHPLSEKKRSVYYQNPDDMDNFRPHECHLCDKKFKRNHHLATHLKKIHGCFAMNSKDMPEKSLDN